MIDAKVKGEGLDASEPEEPAHTNVVDLMAALKKSLGDEKPKKAATRTTSAKPAARRTTKKAAPKRAAGGRRG